MHPLRTTSLAALASLALLPVAIVPLAGAARGAQAPADAAATAKGGPASTTVRTFRFNGGTAREYFEQASKQLAAWAQPGGADGPYAWVIVPNIVLLPGLEHVSVPPMSIAIPADDHTGEKTCRAVLGAIADVELVAAGDRLAWIRLDSTVDNVIRICAEFSQYETLPDGSRRRVPAGPPAGQPATRVTVHAVGADGPEAALSVASAAIKLAGLGDRTELMIHEPSKTLLARTSVEGERVIEAAIGASQTANRAAEWHRLTIEARKHLAEQAQLEFTIAQLREANRDLQDVVRMREASVLDLTRQIARLELAAQQAKPQEAGKQP